MYVFMLSYSLNARIQPISNHKLHANVNYKITIKLKKKIVFKLPELLKTNLELMM